MIANFIYGGNEEPFDKLMDRLEMWTGHLRMMEIDGDMF